MAAIVVCNSSPLIALHQIQQLDLLQLLFGQVLVPPAVVRETSRQFVKPGWLIETPLAKAIDPRIATRSLGPGETEAIALALQLGAAWAILDEKAGRNLARGLGIPVTGTLGILTDAKQQGHLPSVRPLLESLKLNGFFISASLFDHILQIAGESP